MTTFIRILFCLFGIVFHNMLFAQTIQSVVPGSTPEGSSLMVTLTGQNTTFGQGTTTTQVWFNQGSTTLVPVAVTINSSTNLMAQLDVPYGTPLGLYQTNVQNSVNGLINLPLSFEVTAGANPPFLISVNPDSTLAGTTLPVNISGQNTHFAQGTGTVLFHQGSNTLITLSTNAINLTNLGALIDVPVNANPGYYDLTVTNGLDGTMELPFALFVGGGPCLSYDALILNNGCPGEQSTIQLSGGMPPYQIEIDNQLLYSQSPTFLWQPPDTGTYLIESIVDLYGCAANIPDSTITQQAFTASLVAESACSGDTIRLNYVAQSSSPVISAYFNYGTGSGGFQDFTIVTTPGSYTPEVELTNQSGCTTIATADSAFTVYPTPQLQILNQINASCGSNNGELLLSASGTAPFSYSVSGPASFSSTDTLLDNLAPGTYQVTITDAFTCFSEGSIIISNLVAGTPLQGIVSDQNANPVEGARIDLLSLNDTIGIMQVYSQEFTDANGQYNFSQLAEGTYLLHATADSLTNPQSLPTWFGGVSLWNLADTIQINCTQTSTANVSLTSEASGNGAGLMSGFLISSFTGAAFSGYPVFLERTSDGVFLDASITNSNGYYAFNQLNVGDYRLWADIPGLTHTTNFIRTIFNFTQFDNLLYNIDTSLQTIDTNTFIVGIKKQLASPQLNVKVYPNPFESEVILEWLAENNQPIQVAISDLSGRILNHRVLQSEQNATSRLVLPFFEQPSGIYLLEIRQPDKVTRFRLIKR